MPRFVEGGCPLMPRVEALGFVGDEGASDIDIEALLLVDAWQGKPNHDPSRESLGLLGLPSNKRRTPRCLSLNHHHDHDDKPITHRCYTACTMNGKMPMRYYDHSPADAKKKSYVTVQ